MRNYTVSEMLKELNNEEVNVSYWRRRFTSFIVDALVIANMDDFYTTAYHELNELGNALIVKNGKEDNYFIYIGNDVITVANDRVYHNQLNDNFETENTLTYNNKVATQLRSIIDTQIKYLTNIGFNLIEYDKKLQKNIEGTKKDE